MFLRCCWRTLRGSLSPWSTKASLLNLQHCWRLKLVEIAWNWCWNTFLWLLYDTNRKAENLGPLAESIHCVDLPGSVLTSRRPQSPDFEPQSLDFVELPRAAEHQAANTMLLVFLSFKIFSLMILVVAITCYYSFIYRENTSPIKLGMGL